MAARRCSLQQPRKSFVLRFRPAPRFAIWAPTSCVASPTRRISTSSSLPTCRPTFRPCVWKTAGGASAAPLGQLVRGQLVGRGGEQQQLRAHWDQAQQARGHLVLLSGEPGVGKSRLAQDLIAHAQKAGATILRGGCYEYEATTPYLPFVEALRDWARRQSAEQLRTALGATPEIEIKLARSRPTRRFRRVKNACGCSTTPRACCAR